MLANGNIFNTQNLSPVFDEFLTNNETFHFHADFCVSEDFFNSFALHKYTSHQKQSYYTPINTHWPISAFSVSLVIFARHKTVIIQKKAEIVGQNAAKKLPASENRQTQ
jgi:hypothetical protein